MSKKDGDVTCSEGIKKCFPVCCFAKIGRRKFVFSRDRCAGDVLARRTSPDLDRAGCYLYHRLV
jgi:hypothetical protein